ncbi:hypothetical protein DVH24_009214 [Malus domestica]|uniref:Uncharacterized protein n=1 Tax=Malus domestica TaxID=3750 RepID=A0A498JME1_MALDO|nr:hypothetical protein DVH24_009214 [Malus domestica]
MGDPLGSSRVSYHKQNREGVVGAQSGQYCAMTESSLGCGGGPDRDTYIFAPTFEMTMTTVELNKRAEMIKSNNQFSFERKILHSNGFYIATQNNKFQFQPTLYGGRFYAIPLPVPSCFVWSRDNKTKRNKLAETVNLNIMKMKMSRKQ